MTFLLRACVLLRFINTADLFTIEDFSPFKESDLLIEKTEALSTVPESEHLVVFDYCWKNGKFPYRKYPQNRLDSPAFAAELNTRDSAQLAMEENIVRDSLASRYKFSNIYALENSNEMTRVARFIAYSLTCFPASSFTYNSTRNRAMDRVYYMYRNPVRYGLMKLPHVMNTVSVKVTFYEDFFMYNPLKPVPGHFILVNHTKFVANHFMMKKRSIAMYLNGMFNFTENPHILQCTWDADLGLLINQTVLTKMAGSHLVGYAFNGFNDGTVIVDESPYVVLRSQFVAVHGYVYWELSQDVDVDNDTGGRVDNLYISSTFPWATCGKDACFFYLTDYSTNEYTHYEQADFVKKGGIKKVDCDINFRHLCRLYYRGNDPGPDYKDYVEPEPGVFLPILAPLDDVMGRAGGKKCCFLCEIFVMACLLLSAAAFASFYVLVLENKIRNRAVEKRRLKDIAVKIQMDSGKGGIGRRNGRF